MPITTAPETFALIGEGAEAPADFGVRTQYTGGSEIVRR
jgi:hypothetical protein